MTIWLESDTTEAPRREKPAEGRPLVFALLLILATAVVLVLLILGPTLALPLSAALAVVAVGLVIVAWVVAGPRL